MPGFAAVIDNVATRGVAQLVRRGKGVLAMGQPYRAPPCPRHAVVLLESIGGRAADLIVDQAKQWNADLIVMGTHGRRGLRRLALGSDAELVVRSASVPVLLVRGDAGHE